MKKTKVLFLFSVTFFCCAGIIFAAGAADSSEDSSNADTGSRTSFDHNWNDIRYYNSIADYTAATGKSINSFNEAPMLAAKVASGDLPAVEDRISDDPLVIVPYQEIGQYGGYAKLARNATGHFADGHLMLGIEAFDRIAGDLSTQSPNLATSWEMSSDFKTLTVNLRKGVRWSDGEPFTTADIKFWYEDMLSNSELTPNVPATWQAGGQKIGMNFIDDYTFQYVYSVAQPSASELLAHPNKGISPHKQAKHYFQQFHPEYVGSAKATSLAKEAGFDDWVQHFNDKNNTWSDLPKFNTDRPVTTIYSLTEVSPDIAIWERNPYYWKIDVEGNQLPYMDGINQPFFADTEVMVGNIIAGEFTMSIGWYAGLAEYPLLKQNEEKADYTVELWPSLEASATLFQVNRTYDDPVLGPIFADSRFSHALSLALDRDEMNEVVFQGLGTPSQMTLIPSAIYYEPSFGEAYVQYDKDGANKILDELGLKWDAAKEWRLRSDGKRFSVIMDTGNDVLPIHELAVEMWKDVGIEVSVKSYSYEQSSERSMTNQMQLYGGAAGFNARAEAFAASPLFFVPQRQGWENPWGNQWALWYTSDGASGIEPPAEVKKNIERWEGMGLATDVNEKIRLGKEILQSQAENLWTIGTVGAIPLPMPRSNKLRNFPEKGGHDWSIGSWTTPQHPAQFYLLQD